MKNSNTKKCVKSSLCLCFIVFYKKENLNSNGQQIHQYQWQENLNSNGQQIHQYQWKEQYSLIWTHWTQKRPQYMMLKTQLLAWKSISIIYESDIIHVIFFWYEQIRITEVRNIANTCKMNWEM